MSEQNSGQQVQKEINTPINFLKKLFFKLFFGFIIFLNFLAFRALFSHDWATHNIEFDSTDSCLGMAEWINQKSTIWLQSGMV